MLYMLSVSKISARILVQFALPFQLCALLVAVLPNSIQADPILFRPDTHRVTVKTSFFDSDANFDASDGTFERLGGSKYFKVFNLGVLWDQVVSKRGAWRFGLTGSQAESFDGSFVRKNSALTEVMLGYQYFFKAKPIKMKPEIFVIYPVKSVDETTDEVIPSEGAPIAKFGMWFQKRWLSLDNYAYLGFTHRAEGRSSLAEYTLGTKKDMDGIELGAEVSGFESVTDDEFTDIPTQRSAITDAVNGGSRKFFSVNPSLLTTKFYLNLQVSDAFSLEGGYGIDIQGKNVGKGNTIYFNLVWDLSASHQEFTKSRRKKVRNQDLEKFNVEATEYDESLFKENRTKTRKRSNKKSKSVDQILDETEDYLDK